MQEPKIKFSHLAIKKIALTHALTFKYCQYFIINNTYKRLFGKDP